MRRVPDRYLRIAPGLFLGAALINDRFGGPGWLFVLFALVGSAAILLDFHRHGFGMSSSKEPDLPSRPVGE